MSYPLFRFSIPYAKCLGWEVLQILDIFGVWNNSIYIISWVWDPNLNIKFIYASDTPYIHSLKIVLYNISFFCTKQCFIHEVRCQIFHLWHHDGAQKDSNFGAFGFQIFGVGMFNLYYIQIYFNWVYIFDKMKNSINFFLKNSNY